MTRAEGSYEAYFQTLADVDPRRATDLVLGLLDDGTPQQQITYEVLSPAQVRVGQMWEQGRWGVADEHAATAVTETALAALTAAAARPPTSGTHVVVACPEGEWHTLPARMIAGIAGSTGVRVTVLGPSLPAEHLGQRLEAGDVDLLALSCTLPTNLIGAVRSVAAAHAAGVPVIAGGRAFGLGPTRAHAIGADAWAPDADALLGAVPPLCGRPSVLPLEAVLLDAVGDATVGLAYDRLTASFPRLSSMTPFQQARTREDLRWMARFVGAAIVAADDTVLTDFMDWLAGLLAGKVPVPVLAASARILAETIEPDAAAGAQLLHAAADRLESGAA